MASTIGVIHMEEMLERGGQRRDARPPSHGRAQRRELILRTATREFSRRSFTDVTLDDIATEVELPTQTVYNYVGSKEELAIACMRRARLDLKAELDTIAFEAESPEQQLYESVRTIFLYVGRNSSSWLGLIQDGPPFHSEFEREVCEVRRDTTKLISQLLCERREQEGMDPGRVNTGTTAAAVMGSLESVAMWWAMNPEVPLDDIVMPIAATLYGGLPAIGFGSRAAS